MNALYVLTALLAVSSSVEALWWAQAAPMPTARMDASSAVVGDTLYVMGGRLRGGGTANESNQGIEDVVEGYIPAEDRWVTGLPSLPAPMADMACAVIHGRIYLLGGTGVGNILNTAVWSWAPGQSEWQVDPDTLPAPVRGASACSPDGVSLLMIGGLEESGAFVGSVYRFTPGAGFSSEPTLLQARSGACAGTVGGEPIVAGGYFHGPLSSTETLSPSGWNDGPALPSARGSGLACQDGVVLFVLGGQGATGLLDDVVTLAPQDHQWVSLDPMSQGRSRLAGGVVGGYLVAAGGTGRVGYEATGSCERASLATAAPPHHGHPSGALILEARPNPFADQVWIEANLGIDAPWTVSVCRLDGRRVAGFDGHSSSLCLRLADVDGVDQVPCGAYLVTLLSGSTKVTLPVLRVK